MKASDFVEALERFFLDIIGTLLPGFAMLLGWCYITQRPLPNFSEAVLKKGSDYEWVFLVGFAYIIGHGITSFGINVIQKWLEQVYSSERVREALIDPEAKKGSDWVFSFVKPEEELAEKLKRDPVFKAFRAAVCRRIPALSDGSDEMSPRTWRSFALSIAQEHSHLVYRFAFLSLLNLGIATVLICTSVLWLMLAFAKGFDPTIPARKLNAFVFVMVGISPIFLERYYSFARRSFQVPISMALAKLEIRDSDDKKGAALSCSPTVIGRGKVYLAGGFRSGWQDTLMKAVPTLLYFDPRSHGLQSKADYTAWDLEAIRKSDCVFAFLEKGNPGGYALALEVGFAKALGKFVIFVDEKSVADPQTGRYLEMICETADVVFPNLQDGIRYLEKYATLT